MERRLLIKQLIFISGGTILLPSCLQSYNRDLYYKNFTLTFVQMDLIAHLAEVVLPLDKVAQKAEEKLHLFVIKMIDECTEPKKRNLFLLGLKELQGIMGEKYTGKKLDYNQYEEVIVKLERNQFAGNIPEFYKSFKHELINGYMNSKYYMTKIIKYELIPGRYEVHYPVS